jgi:hypothetical protein
LAIREVSDSADFARQLVQLEIDDSHARRASNHRCSSHHNNWTTEDSAEGSPIEIGPEESTNAKPKAAKADKRTRVPNYVMLVPFVCGAVLMVVWPGD